MPQCRVVIDCPEAYLVAADLAEDEGWPDKVEALKKKYEKAMKVKTFKKGDLVQFSAYVGTEYGGSKRYGIVIGPSLKFVCVKIIGLARQGRGKNTTWALDNKFYSVGPDFAVQATDPPVTREDVLKFLDESKDMIAKEEKRAGTRRRKR